MAPEKIILALLSGASGVTSIVSTRIHNLERPEGEDSPALVFRLTSDVPDPHIDMTDGADLWRAAVSVTAFAGTALAAATLLEAVITACHKQSGTIAGYTVAAVLVDTGSGRGGPDYDPTTGQIIQAVDFTLDYYR